MQRCRQAVYHCHMSFTVITAIVCVCLWLLFPKGFKYLVGSWVGAISGAFLWGIAELAWLVGLSQEASWSRLAWSFVAFVVAGIVAGCVLAARG